MKRTKIVCTIGPASEKKSVLEKMVKAGMNIARLNFSHGDYAHHEILIKNIRAAAKKFQEPIAILADLQGPRIRVGELPEKGVELVVHNQVILTTSESKQAGEKIPVTYLNLHKDVKKGDRILLADGLMELKVEAIKGRDIISEVINGGLLTSHKGINLPNIALSLNAITNKDKEDLKFGVSQNVDFVALSFVTSAKDVIDLRNLIKQYEKELGIKKTSPIKIVVKIERHQAVKNFEEILELTDVVMVARGDLGIEMPAEEVPLIQKKLIDQCLLKAKPVIVATQMLESMIDNPRPTRAEVSDVANAVIDHTDAVMLSGETASGKYPVEAVEIMAKVILTTEKSIYDNLAPSSEEKKNQPIEDAIGNTANILARSIDAKAILVASLSGETGRMVSRFRPELPIFVAANNKRVERQLNLSWGVVPFVLPPCKTVEELLNRSISYIKKDKIIKKKDKIIIVAGEPVGKSGVVNLVEIKEI
jgi:pyruvate kinase